MTRERIFKYNSEEKSEKNFIHRIICHTAKKNGNQYTLTILPHFLLQGCLVRADDVFATGINKDLRKDINKICHILGVIDERTARKHLSRFDKCLNDFNIDLSGIISQSGTQLPDKKPEAVCSIDMNINWLENLFPCIIAIREKLFGYENLSLKDIAAMYFFFLHPAYPCATINENCKNIFFQLARIYVRE